MKNKKDIILPTVSFVGSVIIHLLLLAAFKYSYDTSPTGHLDVIFTTVLVLFVIAVFIIYNIILLIFLIIGIIGSIRSRFRRTIFLVFLGVGSGIFTPVFVLAGYIFF